ncbi:Gfo/Idh/MocA family oxidoreductase [Dactylosporangium salmoneum]|uniref:Dehydrogenase n=1 Tax=Dactylosporangium salmoneum TaxID=53361 RepID=A0ABP5UTN9_9ACTN
MKVAVLGAGRMGETVINHLLKSELVDGIVAQDIRPERVAELIARYGIGGAVELDDVLADAGIPVVFVTSSNDAHRELTTRALRAGKAVMTEKPMATRFDDAADMVAEAERTGGFLQVGFELRYSRLYTTVKDWIDAGLLGRVVNTSCTYISSEFWGPHAWRRTKAGSGGMFGEKLSHYVDLSRWWVGDAVRDVYAPAAPNVVPYFEVHDNFHATHRFAGGATGHLTFMMAPAAKVESDPLQAPDYVPGDGHELSYLVVGTAGAARTDVFARTVSRWTFELTDAGLVSTLVETRSWTKEEDHRYIHNTHDQTLDIVRRVAAGQPPSIAPRDALDTMRLCFAAERSAEEGRIVGLDEIG